MHIRWPIIIQPSAYEGVQCTMPCAPCPYYGLNPSTDISTCISPLQRPVNILMTKKYLLRVLKLASWLDILGNMARGTWFFLVIPYCTKYISISLLSSLLYLLDEKASKANPLCGYTLNVAWKEGLATFIGKYMRGLSHRSSTKAQNRGLRCDLNAVFSWNWTYSFSPTISPICSQILLCYYMQAKVSR